RRAAPGGNDLGLVGEISTVNTAFLNSLLTMGLMPVIAPLAMGENGEMLNTNADIAASAIASALKAEKLVYLSDIEGVMVDGTLVSTLSPSRAEQLIQSAAITDGMIPKVRSAFHTVDAGVHKVHIIDGRIKHSLLLEIFTDEGIGTQFVPEDEAANSAS
ncbi:MAG: acetylglutamate kinase, partial [Bacteroidetes bacterium]|nr:acetylglutamate kinase [Bacteroidota bacterium]